MEKLKSVTEIVNTDKGGNETNFVKKLSKTTIPIVSEDDILFCISVDGSEHSEYAFELVAKDFINNLSKLLVVHIYSSKMDHLFNYSNKKDTVIDKYTSKINQYGCGDNTNFILEDRVSKIHALEQVRKLVSNFKANYLVCGFFGFKGAKGDNQELSKGIDYLLGYGNSPTIIVKEKTNRSEKKNGGFNWLFIFDKQYANCLKCLKAFTPLINISKDYVKGIGFYPNYIANDDLERDFTSEMERIGVFNFDYESIQYTKPISQIVSEKINFGTARFDFLVFYNNPDKHRSTPQPSDAALLVNKVAANIGFIN
jgi:hypothetical protein